MFRLFEKHIAFEYLCKYYSKSFHSLDIAYSSGHADIDNFWDPIAVINLK